MGTRMKVGATGLFISLMMVDQAFASIWYCPPVPEFDGPSGIAAMTLLAGVGAILFGRSKNR